jgi:hypothetical protein
MVNEIANKASAVRIKTPEYEIEVGGKITYWSKRATSKRQAFLSKAGAGFSTVRRT